MAAKTTIFSPCRLYRYVLWREWEHGTGYAMFIGLNPSTADEVQNDPTVRRCILFAQEWGYRGLYMTNAFAYRATDPRVMKAFAEPIGHENDRYLLEGAATAGVVVAAWGTHGTHMQRETCIKRLLPNLNCLAKTRHGHPAHPLYLKKTLRPIPWP